MRGRLSPHRLTHLLLATTLALPLSILAAPARMQAIVVQPGSTGAAALQLRSIDTPKPGPDQVLIQVYAAGVNPVDWKRASAGSVPGFDAAGIVDAVGPGVTTFKPGDAVVARADGAYAQYVLATLDSVVLKPKSFTFEQAAGIPVAGIAGYRAAAEAGIKPGQRVAVIGAAGGAGSAAVDTALSLGGGRVIGIGHSSQESYLRGLGVAQFVAYDKEDVAGKVREVDVVLNMVDNQADAGMGYLRRGGTFSSIASDAGGGEVSGGWGEVCADRAGDAGAADGGDVAAVGGDGGGGEVQGYGDEALCAG